MRFAVVLACIVLAMISTVTSQVPGLRNSNRMPQIPTPISRSKPRTRPSRDFWPGPGAYPPFRQDNMLYPQNMNRYLSLAMARDMDYLPFMLTNRLAQQSQPNGMFGNMDYMLPLMAADLFEF